MRHTCTPDTDAVPTAPLERASDRRFLAGAGVALGAAVLSVTLPGIPVAVQRVGVPVGIGIAVFALALPFLTWGRVSEPSDVGGTWTAGTGWLALATLTVPLGLSIFEYARDIAARQDPPNVDTTPFHLSMTITALGILLVMTGLVRFPWRGSVWHTAATYVLMAGLITTGALAIFSVAGFTAARANWEL